MAIKQITINKFETIGENNRNLPNGQFYYLENVSAGEFESSVKHIVNTETTVQDQCILRLLRYGNEVYGIGFDNSTNKDVTLYKYNGSPTNAYVALTNGTVSSTTIRLYNPLFAVMDDYIYFDPGKNYVARYKISTNTMTDTWHAFTGGMQGGTRWKGSLYCWSDNDNNIYKIDGSDLTSMIVIPSDQTVKEIIAYGEYLAIICTASTTSDDGVSRMYLWDGVTTTSFADIIDIGFGDVLGGDILDGLIYVGINFPSRKGWRLKAFSGGIFQTIYTYRGKRNLVSNYIYSNIASQLKSYTGYLYFLVVGARPGSSYASVYEAVLFRYGRQNAGQPNKLSAYKSMEVTPSEGNTLGYLGNDFVVSEDTAITNTTENTIYAVLYEASYKTRQVKSTLTTYSGQAGIVETGNYGGDNVSKQKHLKGITLTYDALTGSGQVTLKYKKDYDTSWTTIFTDNTANSQSHEAVCIESSGDQLPIFKEIAFRTELLYGAELTGISFKYEEEESSY
jgi:hypothetical protein